MVKDTKRVDRQNERGRGEQGTRNKVRHGFLDQTLGGGVGENGCLGGGNTGGNPADHGKDFLWNCWRPGHLPPPGRSNALLVVRDGLICPVSQWGFTPRGWTGFYQRS